MKNLLCGFGVLTVVVAGFVGCTSEGDVGPESVAWCTIDQPDPAAGYAAVSFPDAEVGTVVGGIYRTTDGGRTWTAEEGPLGDMRYTDVVFTDVNTGTIVGGGGRILRTTDGGENWVEQPSGTEATLRGVSFADADNGIVVGTEGTILHTSNGGATWVAQESGVAGALHGVWMSDTATATAVGASGTILRTTDGGNTWEPQTSGTAASLEAVSFASTATGVAVGADGLILRTTDGGQAWARLDGYGTEPLNDIWFADADVGTIVGGGGTFLRTTDAGATWGREPTDASFLRFETLDSEPMRIFMTFLGVSMPDAENGVAVGLEFGTVVQRATVRDGFGVCDPWCAKNAECYPDDAVGCDASCLCDLRYHRFISPACEEALAAAVACLSTLACEQIEAFFEAPDDHPCTAAEERYNEVCDSAG